MATKEPRTTSKEIRGELQGKCTSVSDRTFGGCLTAEEKRKNKTRAFLASHISSYKETYTEKTTQSL